MSYVMRAIEKDQAWQSGYAAGRAAASIALEAEIERLRAALTTLGDVDYFAGVMQWDGWKVATRMRDFARAALEEPTDE